MKFIRNLECTYEVVDGCAYIFNFENNRSYNLNKVATYIYLNIDKMDTDSMVEGILSLYDVSRPAVERDVADSIKKFINLNLIYNEEGVYGETI